MAWVRLDDQIFLHPKIVAAGKDATLLYLSGIAYASSQLTDGFVPVAALRVIAATVNVNPKGAVRLVELGLFEQVDGGYLIHDYLEYNPSATKVRAERDAAKARMQRLRSPDVRANNGRTSGEVPQSPSPSPSPPSSLSLSPSVSSQQTKPTPRASARVQAHGRAREAPTTAVADVVNAITQALAYDQDARLSEKEYERLVASAEQIVGAGGTPDQVTVRAERYARKYPSIAVTHGGLAGHWGELAAEPPARASPNGRASPVTFAQQIEENNKRHDAEFQAALRGQSNAAIGISGADEPTRGRLPD